MCNSEKIDQLFDLLESYLQTKTDLEHILPYHLNVIDELHINENGHSRILSKLLQFKADNHHYELLESLINYLNDVKRSNIFEKINVKNPLITQDKERIDLWVREANHYAIIFENKIYNAADQEAQLSRYINKTKAQNFNEDQIYVIYLSQNGVEEPAKQSWGEYYESDIFKKRYMNASFRNHILPWLKDKVLPNLRMKERAIHSSLVQYIDYLEGLFNKRTNYITIDMELNNSIKNKLNLDQQKTNIDKTERLKEVINDVNTLLTQLSNLKDEYRKETTEEFSLKWKEELNQRYPSLKPAKNNCHIGVTLNYKDEYFNVRIYEDDHLYCQIDRQGYDNPSLSTEIRNVTQELLPRHSSNICFWKYFDINEFDKVFECFKKVIALFTSEG